MYDCFQHQVQHSLQHESTYSTSAKQKEKQFSLELTKYPMIAFNRPPHKPYTDIRY